MLTISNCEHPVASSSIFRSARSASSAVPCIADHGSTLLLYLQHALGTTCPSAPVSAASRASRRCSTTDFGLGRAASCAHPEGRRQTASKPCRLSRPRARHAAAATTGSVFCTRRPRPSGRGAAGKDAGAAHVGSAARASREGASRAVHVRVGRRRRVPVWRTLRAWAGLSLGSHRCSTPRTARGHSAGAKEGRAGQSRPAGQCVSGSRVRRADGGPSAVGAGREATRQGLRGLCERAGLERPLFPPLPALLRE